MSSFASRDLRVAFRLNDFLVRHNGQIYLNRPAGTIRRDRCRRVFRAHFNRIGWFPTHWNRPSNHHCDGYRLAEVRPQAQIIDLGLIN